MSYMDRVDPNLVIKLHYVSKILWIILAAIFGLIGYKLYELGILQTGSLEGGIQGGPSFALKNAGPGLIVMVFALACAVVGAIKSKVTITPHWIDVTAPPPGRDQEPHSTSNPTKRECKLFRNLAQRLSEGPSAYAILNSKGEVDIESMGWSKLPDAVRANAIKMTSNLMSSDKAEIRITVADCELRAGLITQDNAHWGVVFAKPRDITLLQSVEHEDTRPICHWD